MYTMTEKRIKQDIKQADLDKWIAILQLQNKHPSWTNQDIANELKLSRERVRQLKVKINGRSVKEMIELKNSI